MRESLPRYLEQCDNWGRWGPSDDIGTLNFISRDQVRKAATLVREGLSISLARPLAETATTYDLPNIPVSVGGNTLSTKIHGRSITHLDSLSHLAVDGAIFNGHQGLPGQIQYGDVERASHGIIGRGVLLDIPGLFGSEPLEPGTAVTVADLAAAETASRVEIGTGDMLFVRTGWYETLTSDNPPENREVYPGLHFECLPWLHKKEIATLGGDGTNDAFVVPHFDLDQSPLIHRVGIQRMGLWLIDNVNLEDLRAMCVRLDRCEFLCVVAPLRIPFGTGSPVNPIAIF